MGLFSKMLGKKKGTQDEVLEEVEVQDESIRRRDIDIHDDKQRERYVGACLEQISEAEAELERLGAEYDLVTSYLTDMEEIENLPEEIQEQLKAYGERLRETAQTQEQAKKKRRVMKDEDYERMERIEPYMPAAIDKLKEAEEYQTLIKNDLSKLDGERHSYNFRRNEVHNSQINMKGMTYICVGAMALLVMILAVLNIYLEMDVQMGYLIAVVIAATAMTALYVKYEESKRELVRIEKATNKVVLLQNKVKIRYVNNTHLLEYLYMKYDVESSAKLKKLWEQYGNEKKERAEEAKLRRNLEDNQSELVTLLRRCKIKDPDIWLNQYEAFIDSREMVEIRHGLIERRQKLRKQMEYNAKLVEDAQDEVKNICEQYPQYAQPILEMVSDYEAKSA